MCGYDPFEWYDKELSDAAEAYDYGFEDVEKYKLWRWEQKRADEPYDFEEHR